LSLRDQLNEISVKHGGLTPALVVDEARPETHPLHERFEWDDSVAGEAYRRDQARRLIRSVRVVYREADEQEGARTVRAYHAVRDETGNVYRPTDEVVASEFLTQLLLRDMEREWLQLKRRWSRFAEFAEMVKGDIGKDEAA
jgi:hypothetical protein